MSQSYSGKQSTSSRNNYRERTKPWYGTARWKQRRACCIASDKICQMCIKRGIVTPATVADHIVPHKGCEELFWNGELQGLCKACHDGDKKRIEAGKQAKPRIGADGWPI